MFSLDDTHWCLESDLPLTSPRFGVSLFLTKETDDEAVKVHGRTDHWVMEGAPGRAWRKHSVGDTTFNLWRALFGGLEVSDAKKLKALEPHFASDSLSCGRRFRIQNAIDDFSRACLATVVDVSLSGIRGARELERIAEMRGYRCMVVFDNGTKLTSNAVLKWREDRKGAWI